MSREDRRVAIAEATIPLLEEYGALVSTRQIAEAAGVAEGTLFRAFSDKTELLMEAASRVLDPTTAVEQISQLPATESMDQELSQVVGLLHSFARQVRRVMVVVHDVAVAENGHRRHRSRSSAGAFHRGPPGPPRPGNPPGDARIHALMELRTALERRFTPYRDQLRVPPQWLAQLLLSTVMGRVPPGMPDDSDITVDQLVDVLLHGAAAHHPHPNH